MAARIDTRDPESHQTGGAAYGLRVEVSDRTVGGARVVSLTGEASVWNSSPLRDALKRLAETRPREVVIDLSDCTLLSSLAIAAVIDLNKSLRARAGVVRLAGPPPMVLETLLRLRLEQLFAIHTTLAEALGADARRASA